MTRKKKYIIMAAVAAVLTVPAFLFYIELSYPAVRCEGAKHLERPEEFSDCVTCHAKVTPRVTQDWLESKHGVTLVKCVVCHGEPDGKGSIPFEVKPDPMVICARCHDPAINRMVEKYGERPDCNSCHPYHQNPMHGTAYETKTPTTKTTLD